MHSLLYYAYRQALVFDILTLEAFYCVGSIDKSLADAVAAVAPKYGSWAFKGKIINAKHAAVQVRYER